MSRPNREEYLSHALLKVAGSFPRYEEYLEQAKAEVEDCFNREEIYDRALDIACGGDQEKRREVYSESIFEVNEDWRSESRYE